MLIRMGMGSQLSGSVGGVVASHNKGGAYLRGRSVPTNPNSDRQQSVRTAFSIASIGWRALTDAQRAAWEAYAVATPVVNRLGETIILSGFNSYVSTNSFRLGAGSSVLAAAPSPGLVSLGPDFAVTTLSAASGITMDNIAAEANGAFIVALGPPVSAGVSSYGGPYSAFLTGTDLQAIDGAATAGNQSPYRYGAPASGQRRPIRIVGSSSVGQMSNVVRTFVTVSA